MYRAIIADDELSLLRHLHHKLTSFWPELILCAKCSSGYEAREAIQAHQPHIVFLDIEMGDIDGIDIASQLPDSCVLVFVTAFERYAVNAFEHGAIDYLLKPYSDERLKHCIHKAQEYLAHHTEKTDKMDTLQLSIGTKSWLQPVRNIRAFQAQGRYVEVMCEGRSALIRMPFKELLCKLDPESFVQIHRGVVINIQFLDHLKTLDAKHMHAFIDGVEKPFQISRRFQGKFKSNNLTSI